MRYSKKRAIRQVKFYFACWAVLVICVQGVYIYNNRYTPPMILEVIKHEIKPVSVQIDYTIGVREITAYNSTVGQTDDSPCISADGSNICERYAKGEQICAANFVPLGTILQIDKFGSCIVADRMNKKYKNRVDIYMGMDLERALKFGVQKLGVKSITK